MAKEPTPTQMPDFLLERVDGHVLLHHPGLTKTIQLNETAALIWELCDGRQSTGELAKLLEEAFPNARGRVRADLEATLVKLAHEGAIKLE